MMRVLRFDGDKAATRFEFLYEALLAAGASPHKAARTREIVRSEARLLEVLEPISVPNDEVGRGCPACGRPLASAMRTLRSFDDNFPSVTIREDDHALLEAYANGMPWLPRASRQAVDLQDWLSAADKLE